MGRGVKKPQREKELSHEWHGDVSNDKKKQLEGSVWVCSPMHECKLGVFVSGVGAG